MTRRIAAVVILLLLVSAGIAEALNNTLATASQAVLGEKRSQTVSFTSYAYFGYRLTQGRSYAVFCWEPAIDNQGAQSGGCQVDIRNDLDVVVGVTMQDIGNEPFPKWGSFATVTPNTSAHYFVRVFSSNPEPGTLVHLIMMETTLASPWYFVSPSGGYDAYVAIRNHTSSARNATLRAYSNTGTMIGSVTVELPANGNTYVAVSSLGVALGFGSVTVTHDGMPGAVLCNVTTMSPLTGLSFDAPCTARMGLSIIS